MTTAHPHPVTVSPSSAPWLESCISRFHRLATLRAYPGQKQTSPVLKFGTLVHQILRDLYDPQKPGDLPHVGDLDTILRLAVLRSGFGSDDREFVAEKARKLVRTYLQQADAQDAEATVGVEVTSAYDVTVGGEVMYQLSARLDRVLLMDDGLAVAIDYKIGAALPPVNGILVNLAALKAAHPAAKRWEFWIEALGDEGVERTVYRGEDFRGAIKGLTAQVRRYQAAAAEGNYPATVNEGCVWCPLRDTCDAVAVRRISEEELEF